MTEAWVGRGGGSCQDLGAEKAMKEAGTYSGEAQPARDQPGNTHQAWFSFSPPISYLPGLPVGQTQWEVRRQVNSWLQCLQDPPQAEENGKHQQSPENGGSGIPSNCGSLGIRHQSLNSDSNTTWPVAQGTWFSFREPGFIIRGPATTPEDSKDETNDNFCCTPHRASAHQKHHISADFNTLWWSNGMDFTVPSCPQDQWGTSTDVHHTKSCCGGVPVMPWRSSHAGYVCWHSWQGRGS